MSDLITTAKRIATMAHSGQTDKAGAPYIRHPAAVAAWVTKVGCSDEVIAAAWLHDVLEDTNITSEQLFNMGIPWETVRLVLRLTHRRNEPRDEYYDRIKGDRDAVRIKIADILDNLDETRLGLLDEKTQTRLRAKYEHALDYLGV